MTTATATSIRFYDYHPEPSDFFSEVIAGLISEPKVIPPKFFYDEKGSKLFEDICETAEYYPTRAEQQILQDNAEEIASIIGHQCLLVEPGSGNCEKVRFLLDSLRPQAYVPMDISRDHLRKAAHSLSEDYPWLDVHAACIDFTQPIDLSFCPPQYQRIAFFPGSSIGNFEPHAAIDFMAHVAESIGAGGGMLIGVDLKKDKAILDAAYNDGDGVTAAFNLNLLERINKELDANFDIEHFEHHAFYNPDHGRIEMHLRSKVDQTVQIDDQEVSIAKDETIHTENSYKYTLREFRSLAQQAGFEPVNCWTDPDGLFSVHYFIVASV